MSSPAEHPGEEPAAASEAKVQGQGQGAFAQDTSSTGAQKVFEGLVSFSPVEGSAPSMVVMQYLWLSKERRPALALSRVEGDKTNTLVMEPEDCSELEAKDDNLHVQVAGRKCTISWNESCVIPGADVQQARSAFRRVARRLTIDFARYWGFLEDNTRGMAYVTVSARRRTGTSSAAGSVKLRGSVAGTSKAGSSKGGGSRAGDAAAEGARGPSSPKLPASASDAVPLLSPLVTALPPALDTTGEGGDKAAATSAEAEVQAPSGAPVKASSPPAPAPLLNGGSTPITVPPISKGVLQALHHAAVKAARKGHSRTSRTSDAPPVPLEPIVDDAGESAASEPDLAAHTAATIWLQPTAHGAPPPQGAGAGSKGTPRWASNASTQSHGQGAASSREGKSSNPSSGKSGAAHRQALFRAASGSRGAGGQGGGAEEGGSWSPADRQWPGREGMYGGSPLAGSPGNTATMSGSAVGFTGSSGAVHRPGAPSMPMLMQPQQQHGMHGQGQAGMLRQPMQPMYSAALPAGASGWMYSTPGPGTAYATGVQTRNGPPSVSYGGQPMAFMYAGAGMTGNVPSTMGAGNPYAMFAAPGSSSGHGGGPGPMLVPVSMPMDWPAQGQAAGLQPGQS